jgi:hypothetical protein
MASQSTTITAHRASQKAATCAPLWIRWANSMLATIAPGPASSGVYRPAIRRMIRQAFA